MLQSQRNPTSEEGTKPMISQKSTRYQSLPPRAKQPKVLKLQPSPAKSQSTPLEAVADFSNALEYLEANPPLDATLFYSRASTALYEINGLARELQLSGMHADLIIEAFTRIRRIMATSPLGHHMQTWPSGYQGDFGAVEYIASGINRANPGTLAFYLEQAMLHSGIVQQHRYKLRHQSEAFLRALSEHRLRPRMLSVGCGGCRDLLPLLPTLQHFEGELILNDIDPSALAFASTRISAATKHFRPLRAN
jgi:hypothetical protein